MSPVSMKTNAGRSKPGEEITLGILIERAYDAHPDNTKNAIAALEEMILMNEDVFFEVMKPHLHQICVNIMNDGKGGVRRAVWSGIARPSGTAGKHAMKAAMRDQVVSLAVSNLMLFPLHGGIRLGDATRVEISQTADHYAKLAKDTGHKSRWLTLIAQSLGDGEKVSDKFTEERLAELKREAEHAA
jgi:hypothetical protein